MNYNFAEKISPALVSEYLTLDSLYFVLLSYLLLYLAKKINDFWQKGFSIDEELVIKDNKAVAISFSGYFLGVGIILYAVISSPASHYFDEFFSYDGIAAASLDTIMWSLVGIILLNFSRTINDKFFLPHFKNQDEIIRDQNVGTGVVQLGSYIASALVIAAIISSGESRSLFLDLFFTVIYYLTAQICLVIFSKVYERVLTYPLHAEIEKDNVAAGLAYSLNLLAMGIFLAFPLGQTENIWVFLTWFVNGVVFIVLSKVLFSKIILKKSNLQQEIQTDQNWGVAFLEGSIAIIIAYIVNASLL